MPVHHPRAGTVSMSLTLEEEAVAILKEYAPPRTRRLGSFVSRLLYEERARREERARLQKKVARRAS